MRFSFLLLFLLLVGQAFAQDRDRWRWMEPADTLNKGRFWGSVGTGAAIYSGAAYGLYQTWYKDFELTKFRTFNDAGEWNQMDKMGHFLTTYTEARLLYDGARWTGLDKKRSLWLAGAASMFLQSTVEVMDGFSAEWGFSWSDMGANALGMGAFVTQEAIWDEQRILLKISTNRRLPSPDEVVFNADGSASASVRERHLELYGRSLPERFLKDYNTMTIWASANIAAFAPQTRWPKWLNVAVGYGSANLYGGFGNSWSDDEGNVFRLPDNQYERYREFYLSFDIDLKRIPTRRRFLRSVLSIINFIKIPAPALEINTAGRMRFHPVYF
ncbi:MAG: DUF2279 domain-containing protein [Bacteroidota bacterium]